MRKFLVLVVLAVVLAGAAAFRYASRGSVRLDRAAVEKWKKAGLVSCRVAPEADGDSVDVPPLTGWGPHRWTISTRSDSAQFYFNQGINLYYAFHTLEARASFAKAIRFDPACAMAYYGKALSLGPTINFGNGFRAEMAAWEAAQLAKKYRETCTPLEKGLIDAILVRYSADTTADLIKLQQAYTSAMKGLANGYPRNADIVSLYADAMMLEHPWDLYDGALHPRAWTPLIRKTLEQALAIDSLHPGALHFMIHTVEGSPHPEDGIKSAESLAGLMPDVAHVVHMPSHIYIRSGDYRKGVEVNDRAVASYNKYLGLYQPVAEQSGLYLLHAIHLKAACGMMAANYKAAAEASDTLQSLVSAEMMRGQDGFGNFIQYAYHFKTFTLIRFGMWKEILGQPAADTASHYACLLDHFARGIAMSRLGQQDAADRELALVNAGLAVPSLRASNDPFSDAYQGGLVARYILEGVIAEGRGRNEEARTAFEAAVRTEDALVYDEPRDWALPARHYLGDLLLTMGRPAEAAAVFNRDLQINPLNGWSLTGLREAYDRTKDRAGMKRVDAQLQTAWQMRDREVKRAVY